MIDSTIRQGGLERINEIVELIHTSGALRDSMEVARKRSAAAMQSLAPLPDSAWKDALLDLAAYSVSRNH